MSRSQSKRFNIKRARVEILLSDASDEVALGNVHAAIVYVEEVLSELKDLRELAVSR